MLKTKTFLFTFLSLTLSIFLLEIILQIFSLFLTLPQDLQNKVAGSDAKIRILTLGESTTAAFYSDGQDQAWPRLLERKLNLADIPSKVFNKATPGTISPITLSKMQDMIDFYNPHLIIAMVGINDFQRNLYLKEKNIFLKVLNKLKITKMMVWLAQYLKVKARINERKNSLPYVKKILQDIKSTKLLNLKYISQVIHENLELKDTILELVASNMRSKTGLNNLSWLNTLIESYPQEFSTHSRLLSYLIYTRYTQKKYLECAKSGMNALEKDMRIDEHSMAMLSECVVKSNLKAEFNKLNTNYQFTEKKSLNYHIDFYKIAAQNKIPIIFMQYPTLSLEGLKEKFATLNNPQDLFFLSNENNFKQELNQHPYEYLFTDQFAGSFGHTTNYGSNLIAQNVFTFLIQHKKLLSP